MTTDEQACLHCEAATARDVGLCGACGQGLLHDRPSQPAVKQPVPLAEGIHRFEGSSTQLAAYLDRVAQVEQGYDRRAARWALFCAIAGLAGIGSGIWAFYVDLPYWWAPPAACAALLLFGLSRFGKASEFDLPEERLDLARTLLRGLAGRGWQRVDLTLDLRHQLQAEVLEGVSPMAMQIKAGASARAGERRVQRQRWLLLTRKDGPPMAVAATDLFEMDQAPDRGGTSGPRIERSHSCLQLWIKQEKRDTPAASTLAEEPGEWRSEAHQGSACWVLRTPSREIKTTYFSEGKSRTTTLSEGRTLGATDVEALVQLLVAG